MPRFDLSVAAAMAAATVSTTAEVTAATTEVATAAEGMTTATEGVSATAEGMSATTEGMSATTESAGSTKVSEAPVAREGATAISIEAVIAGEAAVADKAATSVHAVISDVPVTAARVSDASAIAVASMSITIVIAVVPVVVAVVPVSPIAAVPITASPIAVIPGACSDKDAAKKPARSVITVGGASIRIVRIVAPRANRRGTIVAVISIVVTVSWVGPDADSHTDLRLSERCWNQECTEQSEIT